MTTDRRHIQHLPPFSKGDHEVVETIPVEKVIHLGIMTPVPVVELPNIADQRKWCRAVQDWLEEEIIPSKGCPTNNLHEDGSCQRSPKNGQCLLLLPFDHPDWTQALAERFDTESGSFYKRDVPLPPPSHRQPIALEELERCA